MSSKKRLLWLDDCRNPHDNEVDWLVFSPIGRDVEVHWVKSYREFTKWITDNGLPDGICFDHDLGKETERDLIAQGYSKKEARKHKGEEKSGHDCAKWLIDYCIDHNLNLPAYSSQSANPVGRENLLSILDQYKSVCQ